MDKHVIGIDIGSKNYAICVMGLEYNIHSWDILNIVSTSKSVIKDTTIKNLHDQLDLIIKDCNISQVLVERQMRQNMQFLTGATIMYFTAKNIPVTLVSATSKLKPYESSYTILKGTNNYAKRKKVAIQIVTDILNNQNANVNMIKKFEKSKKKDDYSDSFLYAYNFIKSNF